VEILIDKSVAEIFIDSGRKYVVKEIPATTSDRGIELAAGRRGSIFNTLDIFTMSSMWDLNVRDRTPVR
jgi:sucrose-6-phosphate hydrolase SacC (GH32 family)